MFCHKCGAQLAPEAGFCVKCGTPVFTGTPPSQEAPSAPRPLFAEVDATPSRPTPESRLQRPSPSVADRLWSSLRRLHWSGQLLWWGLGYPLLVPLLIWRQPFSKAAKIVIIIPVFLGLAGLQAILYFEAKARQDRPDASVVSLAPTQEASPASTLTPSPVPTPRATRTPVTTPTTATTAIPIPTASPRTAGDPQAAMIAAMRSAFGKPDKGRPPMTIEVNPYGDCAGCVIAEFPVRDQLTMNMTRDRLVLDMAAIAKAGYGSQYPVERLSLLGTFPLKDAYGNTKEGLVARVILPRPAYEKINWESFNVYDLFQIGEDPYLHPELQKK